MRCCNDESPLDDWTAYLRAGVDRLAAYVKKLPKETIVEPLKKAELLNRRSSSETWRRERDSGLTGFSRSAQFLKFLSNTVLPVPLDPLDTRPEPPNRPHANRAFSIPLATTQE